MRSRGLKVGIVRIGEARVGTTICIETFPFNPVACHPRSTSDPPSEKTMYVLDGTNFFPAPIFDTRKDGSRRACLRR